MTAILSHQQGGGAGTASSLSAQQPSEMPPVVAHSLSRTTSLQGLTAAAPLAWQKAAATDLHAASGSSLPADAVASSIMSTTPPNCQPRSRSSGTAGAVRAAEAPTAGVTASSQGCSHLVSGPTAAEHAPSAGAASRRAALQPSSTAPGGVSAAIGAAAAPSLMLATAAAPAAAGLSNMFAAKAVQQPGQPPTWHQTHQQQQQRPINLKPMEPSVFVQDL